MVHRNWDKILEDAIGQSKELLDLFRERYPCLTHEQLVRLAVRWYMKASVNHGMDPETLEPIALTIDDDAEGLDWLD